MKVREVAAYIDGVMIAKDSTRRLAEMIDLDEITIRGSIRRGFKVAPIKGEYKYKAIEFRYTGELIEGEEYFSVESLCIPRKTRKPLIDIPTVEASARKHGRSYGYEVAFMDKDD